MCVFLNALHCIQCFFRPWLWLFRFGPEIHFDDLIRAHEARHGKLWRYGAGEGAGAAAEEGGDGGGGAQGEIGTGDPQWLKGWKSSDAEKVT